MEIPERKRTESFIKVIVENFLILDREINIQIHEAQKKPNRLNLKRDTLGCLIIKYKTTTLFLTAFFFFFWKWQQKQKKQTDKMTSKKLQHSKRYQ